MFLRILDPRVVRQIFGFLLPQDLIQIEFFSQDVSFSLFLFSPDNGMHEHDRDYRRIHRAIGCRDIHREARE